MRLKFVAVGLATLLVTAIWFLAVYKPGQTKVSDLRGRVDAMKQEVLSLEANLAHLQQLQRNEKQLTADLARFSDALPPDPRVPDFILQVQEAAVQAKLDFISIAPSLPAPVAASAPVAAAPENPNSTPAPTPAASEGSPAASAAVTPAATGLQSIGVTLTIKGPFFAVEDFVYRLEHLARAVRIDGFNVSGGGAGSGGSLSVSLNTRVFTLPRAESATSQTPGTPVPTAAAA